MMTTINQTKTDDELCTMGGGGGGVIETRFRRAYRNDALQKPMKVGDAFVDNVARILLLGDRDHNCEPVLEKHRDESAMSVT